jgi:iron complex transport system permease protein
VIGVSAGAAVGASAAIVLGAAAAGGWVVATAAFVGGLATTLLVYALSKADGRTEVVTLVLTGVALNAFAGGLLAFFTYVADEASRDQIVFWQLGSLNGATWSAVGTVLPLTVVGIVVLRGLAGQLDLLALGERPARHLGVDVERLRRVVIVVVALLVASGVAFTGIIAFIGLIVPHVVRMIAGPGHRLLIPASALTGALVLVLADLFARTAVENADLPIGMLTSLIGGPVFFWLLRRTRRTQGGWA